MQDNKAPYNAPYGRKQLTVTRTSGARHTHAAEEKKKDEKADARAQRVQRTTKSALICTCVICAAVLVRMIDTPFTDAVSEGVRTALTFDLSAEDAIGRLKFVQTQVQDAATVFSAGQTQVQEADTADLSHVLDNAQVAAAFDAPSHPYLELTAPSGAALFSPAAGVVSAASQEKDSFSVAVEYANGCAALFRGRGSLSVAKGDSLEAGAQIGRLDASGEPLLVYAYRDGACVDPLSVIGK